MTRQTINDFNFSFEVDKHIPKEDVKVHSRFNKFLQIAKNISEQSNYKHYKLGACISIKGRTVSKGFNQEKTHPRQKKYNALRHDSSADGFHKLHAEMVALNDAIRSNVDLSNAEITVYRKGTDGTQKMARPCAACMAAIKDAGIKVVNYSTPDGVATEYISKENKIQVKRATRPI